MYLLIYVFLRRRNRKKTLPVRIRSLTRRGLVSKYVSLYSEGSSGREIIYIHVCEHTYRGNMRIRIQAAKKNK